jgi:hypothetical protein
MKKLGIFALAALLVVMFTLPAMAVEHQFGGYWRTRFYTDRNFTGEDDTEAADISQTDTRTRLYYTAVLNDNLKLVNKFEFDAVWGPNTSYGDVGADAVAVEVKNSYAEFKMGNWLNRVGTQGLALARGFLFDNDGTGFLAIYLGETFTVPLLWLKADEGGAGQDMNEGDVDAYVILPTFHLSETMKINPYILYIMSEDASKSSHLSTSALAGIEELQFWNIGVDFDMATDAFSLWLTGIFQGGEADLVGGGSLDISTYLFAIGASGQVGPAGLHGQFVYASGDDDLTDTDVEAFMDTGGASYYWSEIMGYGTFDNQVSNGSPADKISNIYFINFGADFKPADKLKLSADLWYASVVEAAAGLDEQLGTEIDLKLTYELVEGLNLDLVAAYLFAGESTTFDAADDANPYELGARLSLSF